MTIATAVSHHLTDDIAIALIDAGGTMALIACCQQHYGERHQDIV